MLVEERSPLVFISFVTVEKIPVAADESVALAVASKC